MARTDIFTSIRSSLSSEEPWAAAKACTNTYRIFAFQSMDFLLSLKIPICSNSFKRRRRRDHGLLPRPAPTHT
jgi:hypothetical protein